MSILRIANTPEYKQLIDKINITTIIKQTTLRIKKLLKKAFFKHTLYHKKIQYLKTSLVFILFLHYVKQKHNKGDTMQNIKLMGIDENGKEKEFNISDFKGKKTVLYFYPKDNTSGCTQEACNFRDNMNRLLPFANIVGVSPDDIKSHIKFKETQHLNFPLLSDTDHSLAEAFSVWKEKSMYGRKYMGIERSTFILDENLNIIKEWRNVKVLGHVDSVLSFLTKK